MGLNGKKKTAHPTAFCFFGGPAKPLLAGVLLLGHPEPGWGAAEARLETPRLTATWGEGACLGGETQALSYLPSTGLELPQQLLDPLTGFDRFSLSFLWQGLAVTFVSAASPGAPAAPFQLQSQPDPLAPAQSALLASLTFGPLRITRTLSWQAEGQELLIQTTLFNRDTVPLTQLEWLSALNPDPDLESSAERITENRLLEGPDLAVAIAPHSKLAIGLGWLAHEGDVGFCSGCVAADALLEPPPELPADVELALRASIAQLAPGEAVVLSSVLRVEPDLSTLEAGFYARFDRDEDGFSPLEGDCDDADSLRSPATAERCDGVDQDCDGNPDNGTVCADDDGDGISEREGDCNDADATLYPLASECIVSSAGAVGDGLDNDCDGFVDEGCADQDDDRDGFSELEGDCQDLDPSFYPGQQDIPYDGIDQDCDGSDRTDQDVDGFVSTQVGGTDCNDLARWVYPGAPELANQLDDDCDGRIDEGVLPPGSVLIHEVLFDPQAVSDRNGEFIELLNASRQTLELSGWVLQNSNGQRHTIAPSSGSLLLRAGERLLLATRLEEDYNGGLRPTYVYTGFVLGNTTERLSLLLDGEEQDALSWGGELDPYAPPGASLQRDPSCLSPFASAQLGCWCASTTPWRNPTLYDSDLGTPAEANDVCPSPPIHDQDQDGVTGPQVGGSDCNDLDASIYPGAIEIPYDRIDQDCDGSDARDLDGDGMVGVAGGGLDCDDLEPHVYAGAPEDGGTQTGLQDGLDNDCDGQVDEGCLDIDDDGDGFSELQGDCDDGAAHLSPAAVEQADGLDNNCDGQVDPLWVDDDGDGYSSSEGDCDPDDFSSYPGAPELADGKDQDCDGILDEGTSLFDDDGDGFSEAMGDCNDAYASIHPGAVDVCSDGIDQDCDGSWQNCALLSGGCSFLGTSAMSTSGGGYWLLLGALGILSFTRRKSPRSTPESTGRRYVRAGGAI